MTGANEVYLQPVTPEEKAEWQKHRDAETAHREAAAIKDARLKPIELDEFLAGRYETVWLIENVLVEGQPAFGSGPVKTMKTSMLMDLAISLAAGPGVNFLNHYRFPVMKKVRVAMYSGESGRATLQGLARRILASKNRKAGECSLCLCFDLPNFSDDSDLASLKEHLQKAKCEVAIFDPLYLCGLTGEGKYSPADVHAMGSRFAKITKLCLGIGVTPILVHHTTKAMSKSYEVPELTDMAFAGAQEFARQWLLIGRRSAYEVGTGVHKLWLNVGGSAGFNGTYGVDIDEGKLQRDFTGMKWDVSVMTQSEVITAARQQIAEAGNAKTCEEQRKIEEALTHYRCEGGAAMSAIADFAGISHGRAKGVLERMVGRGSVVKVEQLTKSGKPKGVNYAWKELPFEFAAASCA